jgi:hypothetical protein
MLPTNAIFAAIAWPWAWSPLVWRRVHPMYCDANDPQSPYSLFMAKHGSETKVLKPEENTKPSVVYRKHEVEMEKKIPKGRVHDPYSYEIETWAQLAPEFPKKKRVIWARVDAGSNITMINKQTPKKTEGKV